MTYFIFLPILITLFNPLGVEIWQGTYQAHSADFQLLPISVVRTYIRWSEIETSPGVYTWPADTDNALTALANRRIILSIHDTPKFYLPAGESRTCAPPAMEHQAEFVRFVKAAVAHYPMVGIWEFWNEPEFESGADGFFGCWGSYGGAYYGSFMTAFYSAVKDVNPRAQVMFGSMSADSPTTFLQDAMTKGAKFDLVGIHLYSVESVPFDVTVSKGDKWRAISPAPVWVTETSHLCYASCGAAFEENQAAWLRIVRGLTSVYPVIVWYGLDDPDWLESGMYNHNRRKQVWFEYQGGLVP